MEREKKSKTGSASGRVTGGRWSLLLRVQVRCGWPGGGEHARLTSQRAPDLALDRGREPPAQAECGGAGVARRSPHYPVVPPLP